MPKNLKGTQWIGHKWNAMKNVLENYGTYIGDLEQMTRDKSYPKKDRAKFKGCLIQWKDAKTPLHLALFIEFLSHFRLLSLAFQS